MQHARPKRPQHRQPRHKQVPDNLPWVCVSRREFTAYGPFDDLDQAKKWIAARSEPLQWVYRKLYPPEII